MTAPTPALAAVTTLDVPVDPLAWSAWLTERTSSEWRPGEWDPTLLLFSGDPSNPETSIYLCSIQGCGLSTANRNGPCGSCGNQIRRSGVPESDFVPTENRRRERALLLFRSGRHAERCMVTGSGDQCGRDVERQDLCLSHVAIWHRYLDTNAEVTLHRWATEIAVPKKSFGPCLVLGCHGTQTHGGSIPLCALHSTRWYEDRRQTRSHALEQWAAQEAPIMSENQFSLAQLSPLVRLEVLYGLQRRDGRGRPMRPPIMRTVIKDLANLDTLLTHSGAFPDHGGGNSHNVAREFVRWAKSGYEEFRGLEPGHNGNLDLLTIGVSSRLTRSGKPQRAGTVSLDGVQQHWLRDLLVAWLMTDKPPSTEFRATLKSCVMASTALALRPGGGHDPSSLGVADMDAVVDAYVTAKKEDGVTPLGVIIRKQRRRMFGELLVWGRRADVLDHVPAKFAMQVYHRIPRVVETEEDEAGKAVPEYVIRQLNDHIGDIGRGWIYGQLESDDVILMMQTVYIVCRDTGRRPAEFCGLKLDCLKYNDGEYELIWDNRKGKRLKRLLPIEKRTAEAILNWRKRRLQLVFPERSDIYLFPSDSEIVKSPHLQTHEFGRILRAWVDAILTLVSDMPGDDGRPLPFDRTKIFAYAFRSSFAQRHADAGTDIDVLMSLMDHKDPNTTMGYYRVTIERKRKAVETVRIHSVDRNGNAAPFSSSTSYEAKSVAVPYGNCVEPSNVKAGGKKCPIRFQCAGCGFYRPDPSYRPAIEDHIRSLKADRETAMAMGVDDFVLRNLGDQITAFGEVVERMNTRLDQMPDEVRAEVEEASRVLRKIRAGGGRALLPLTVVTSAGDPR